MLNHRIFQKNFQYEYLLQNFRPAFNSKNKRLLQKLHEHVPYESSAELVVSRWSVIPSPMNFDNDFAVELEIRPDIYQYSEPDTANEMHWYQNFADRYLFVAYDGALFAQDEMQVAEHPILGNLVEALRRQKYPGGSPLTVENGEATPILIQNAVRKINFDSMKSGIYGNQFARSSENAIINATTVLNEPTKSNIFAIEAPSGYYGIYNLTTIDYIFTTAYTAYKAVKIETTEKLGPYSKCVIHTGNWGTGAYGGSHTLMALLQLLAARYANIDKLVYHTFSNALASHANEAKQLYDKLTEDSSIEIGQILMKIFEYGFKWGVSDGN